MFVYFTEFQDIYTHPAPRTLAEAGYLVDNHLFLPYDMHSQPFIRQKYIYPVEEGQFDDHSDENGEKSPSWSIFKVKFTKYSW